MWETVGNPIPCFDISQQVYHNWILPHEKCTRLRHGNDLWMSIKFHLVVTSSFRPTSTSTRHDYTICIHAASMHRDCASRRRASATVVNLHLDTIDLSPSKVDSTTTDVHQFSASFPTTAKRDRYKQCMQTLPFRLLLEDLTHRRRSRRKIAYELNRSHTPLAKIEFARSFRQRRDEFIEAWTLKISVLAQKIANLLTFC